MIFGPLTRSDRLGEALPPPDPLQDIFGQKEALSGEFEDVEVTLHRW